MGWYEIAKAVLGMAAVLSVPCSLGASSIIPRNTISSASRTAQLLPGSAAWVAANVTARPVVANSQSALKAVSGSNAIPASFGVTPEPLGIGQSLQVSINVVRSATSASDERTVATVLYQSADKGRIMRPQSNNFDRYETVDGTVRPEKHEEVLISDRFSHREIKTADDFGPLADDNGLSSNNPEPSTFALLGLGLLFLLKRGVWGRCI
jgi:hypothetical protein